MSQEDMFPPRDGSVESATSQVTALLASVSAAAVSVQTAIKTVRGIVADTIVDDEALVDQLTELVRRMEALEQLRSGVGPVCQHLRERADLAKLRLETDLRDAITARGWRVDGRWPILQVERGVAVEVDEKKQTVTVGGKKLARATAHRIIAALDTLVPTLYPKQFEPGTFMATVASAYDALTLRGALQTPIFDIYRESIVQMQDPRFWKDVTTVPFRPLGVDQFRARLSESLERGFRTAPNGREIRLLPPLDTKDGLFMYLPAEQRFGYIGRIEFIAIR